ncbi:tripartite motif-containing protein 43-like [Monodelphis domestica]|uniref:tripartite motif-containing protein 43-like n=1 Tax=Monodelphis domestica TaxID=13616 RepID=UPI0024E22E0A|nr:tripartite motif-containing protein 43-like [Monodelphis domestica]
MASKEMKEGLQDTFTCTICQASLTDPVTVDCGHRVCQSCLDDSSQASGSFSCPECRKVSQSRAFKLAMRRRKYAFNRRRAQRSEGPSKCDRHLEAQTLFCMDDKTLLCVSCSQSQEHEAHTIQPIEAAAGYYRKKLQENMKLVRETLKDVQKLILEEKKVPRTWAVLWTEQVEMPRKTFQEKFKEISDFLSDEEEEVHSLMELDEEENEMFEHLKEHEVQQEIQNREKKMMSNFQLSQHKNDLREMVIALEEKSQMPDKELLQDAGNTLSKSESLLLQKPEPFTPFLSHSYCMDLTKFLKRFQESRRVQCHYPYEFTDDRKRTITFADTSSGQMYAVYTSGSLHYINGMDLSFTRLDMDGMSEEEQEDPIFACYCVPVERENSISNYPSKPSIEWH